MEALWGILPAFLGLLSDFEVPESTFGRGVPVGPGPRFGPRVTDAATAIGARGRARKAKDRNSPATLIQLLIGVRRLMLHHTRSQQLIALSVELHYEAVASTRHSGGPEEG